MRRPCVKIETRMYSATAGSFRAIPTSRPRPLAYWTCMRAAGNSRHCARTSSSPPTRRPAFRPVCASTRVCRPALAGRCAWSMSTPVSAPEPTWPHSMCTAPRCSAAANQPPASRRSSDWLSRSCANPRTTRHAGCSESWTTDRRIVARLRCAAFNQTNPPFCLELPA